jgi:hypothetical protein
MSFASAPGGSPREIKMNILNEKKLYSVVNIFKIIEQNKGQFKK